MTLLLGAKGAVELQLISSGEKWGRGPNKDIHSSLKANVDTAIDKWFDDARSSVVLSSK